MSLLSLDAVTLKRGRRTVLGEVSVAIASRRLTVLIGPNGAGKSTLLDVAAGLLPPTAGAVRLGDVPLQTISRRALAARRAYLPQNPQVDWAISVERVVALGLSAHLPAFGGLPARWRQAIDAALERFDLLALRDRPATQLSGGELARVMLARVTVGEPELLLVDEPTTGLDPRHALDAAGHLRALADEGRTVVVALHDLDLAARIADDVVALKHGRLVAHGRADEVMTDAVLGDLYDVAARVTRDADGLSVRFLP